MTSVREEEWGHTWRVTMEAAFRRKAFWKNGKKKVNGRSEPQASDVGKKKSNRNNCFETQTKCSPSSSADNYLCMIARHIPKVIWTYYASSYLSCSHHTVPASKANILYLCMRENRAHIQHILSNNLSLYLVDHVPPSPSCLCKTQFDRKLEVITHLFHIWYLHLECFLVPSNICR